MKIRKVAVYGRVFPRSDVQFMKPGDKVTVLNKGEACASYVFAERRIHPDKCAVATCRAETNSTKRRGLFLWQTRKSESVSKLTITN